MSVCAGGRELSPPAIHTERETMALLPYYTMYPQDFDCDETVRLMEDCELGMFIRMLNHSWVNDGLPGNADALRRTLRYTQSDFDSRWPAVEPCFPISTDGRRRNPRQEQERSKAIEKTNKSKKAAASRWNADAMPTQCERIADAMTRAYDSDSDSSSEELKKNLEVSETPQNTPETTGGNQSPHLPPVNGTARAPAPGNGNPLAAAGFDFPEDFERWWNALVAGHPNRNKNAVARTRIMESVLLGNFDRGKFQAGYERLKAGSPQWTEDGGRFAPNLYEIIANDLWKFAPPNGTVKKTDKERGLAG